MDLSKYLGLYLSEGREHVSALRKGLGSPDPSVAESVQELFRHAHSLKGMAASMGFETTERVAHDLEALLNLWRQGASPTEAQMRAAMNAVDVLDEGLDTTQREGSDAGLAPRAEEASRVLGSFLAPEALPAAAEAVPPRAPAPGKAARAAEPGKTAGSHETTRIKVTIAPACPLPAARLLVVLGRAHAYSPDSAMDPGVEVIQREGLRAAVLEIPAGPGAKDLARSLQSLADVDEVEILHGRHAAPLAGPGLVGSLRISADDLDALRADAADLLYRLNLLEAELSRDEKKRHKFWLEAERAHLARLFERVIAMRLVPFEILSERVGRTVRELSSRLGKPVRFEIAGAEEHVDKGILERLLDPLTHLVRNALDHGIEAPEARRAAGKPEEGRLALTVRHDSEALLVSIQDDGRGVDPAHVRREAAERGLLGDSAPAVLDRMRLLDLLTLPAFSTRREATAVSGRGVGLDVVRSGIESLGGHLEMESEPGKGCTFTLVIPSATTLTRVIVFGWDETVHFGLPASQVSRLYPLSSCPLVWSGDRRFLQAGGELLPVIAWNADRAGPDGVALRLAAPGQDRVLLVGRVLQGEQVIVMPWGQPLERMEEWMGGALLATGDFAYILDGRVLAQIPGD